MSEALEALRQKVTEMTAQAEATNTKADALITLVGSLRDKIAELIDNGNGATPEELVALGDQIQTATDAMVAQAAENEAALTEPPAPSPAPFPPEAEEA